MRRTSSFTASFQATFAAFALLGVLVLATDGSRAENEGDSVELWDVFEGSFRSSSATDRDTEITVDFIDPSGERREQAGFRYANGEWRVRFRPDRVGEWRYRSRSNPAVEGLDGVEGRFACERPSGADRFSAHGPIRVSENGRHFEHRDGTPFLWLADTAWNGALLSREDDWDRYLDDRVAKGFTAVQFVVTQWRTAYTNLEGEVAYTGYDDIEIHPEFFHRIDARLAAVNQKGLLAVPVLLWTLGKRENNPGQLPEDQAIRLARYLDARYGAYHIAYFLPGDGRYFDENAERWKRIGRAVFGEGEHAPVFLHPQGMQWPYDSFRDEDWLSAYGYQSGHGDDERTLAWLHSGPPSEKWRERPAKPVINLEPPYEDHIAYQSRERHTAYTVRRALWWSLLNAPTAGTSYGAHGIWSWEVEPKEPQEHGGTGVAKPWYEAMSLPGSRSVQRIAEIFATIPWWTLLPDQELVIEDGSNEAPRPRLLHLLYTRRKDGETALFVDGERAGGIRTRGDASAWETDYRLALGNELTGDRPWRGVYHRVALFDRALGDEEAATRFAAGLRGAAPSGAIALYVFKSGDGRVVRDRSGLEPPIDLEIRDGDAVEWLEGGGLRIRGSALIASPEPATRISEAVRRSGELTIEAWVEPADLEQTGPARVVTLSRNTGERNFTLGQKGDSWEVRFRTTETSPNGEPATSTSSARGGREARHIARSRAPDGSLAVVYLPEGGAVTIDATRLARDWRSAWWDPRSGEHRAAKQTNDDARRVSFRAPDEHDWVLVISSKR